jgi:CubicO group peptidase (beta-lactamase class C family)
LSARALGPRLLALALAALAGAGALAQTPTPGAPPPPNPTASAASPLPAASDGPAEPGVSAASPAVHPVRRPLSSSPTPQADPAQAPAIPAAQLEAFVDGVVREAMAQRHIAGVAVSIVQNGQVVLAKGYGAARVDPWRPVDPTRTLFRLGDVSQAFTWIVMLQQVAAGHVRLDGPVNLYLPEALRIPDQNGFRPITVQDILAGRSGFEDRTLGQAYERDFGRVRPLATYLREERPRRVREPGALVARVDYGAALVGEAASEVAGKPFETLVEDKVIAPLGLRHTSFREPHPDRSDVPAPLAANLAAELSDGYRWAPTGLRLRPFAFIAQRAPSGSASASAADMGRIMVMLLGGGAVDTVGVLAPEGVARMLGPGSLFADRPLPHGVAGLELDGGTLSFRSAVTLAPAMKLGVFVAVNTDSGAPLVGDLANDIVEQFHAGGAPSPAMGAGRLEAQSGLDGPWLSDKRAYGGLEGFIDRFRRLAWVRALDDHRLLLTTPSGTSRWTVEAGASPLRLHDLDGPSELAFAPGERPTVFFSPSGQAAYERPALTDRPELLLALAALTIVLSLVALAEFPVRLQQSFRESQGQRRAAVVQTVQSALWLAAAALTAVAAWQGRDPAALMYDWPGVPLVTASSCALVASALLLPILLLMPPVWRGGRRLESWSVGRKLAFTLTSLVFLAFAVVLGLSGALQPWSA